MTGWAAVKDPTDAKKWCSAETTNAILGGVADRIPDDYVNESLTRVRHLRDELKKLWIGLDLADDDHIIDWILATLIARENLLLIGPPGAAKTEISTTVLSWLNLEQPQSAPDVALQAGDSPDLVRKAWTARENTERQKNKYFWYLLSRFTQPEELFGPIEIQLLRQGILARVNFGLLTGPGVRAAFLDEVFKASGNILNALLTLTQERRYFNWGGMVPSDLLFLIGASNELPGAFASGAMVGPGSDDFQALYAFLDRFPVRLYIDVASGQSDSPPGTSDLHEATRIAIARDRQRFTSGHSFQNTDPGLPSINDILLLGRACAEEGRLRNSDRFFENFLGLGCDLQQNRTLPADDRITWTISPRKLKALHKVAVAHALLRHERFPIDLWSGPFLGGKSPDAVPVDFRVFSSIWDSLKSRDLLERQVNSYRAVYTANKEG